MTNERPSRFQAGENTILPKAPDFRLVSPLLRSAAVAGTCAFPERTLGNPRYSRTALNQCIDISILTKSRAF